MTNTRDRGCLRTNSIPTVVVSTRDCSKGKASSGTNWDRHSQASSGQEKKWQAGSSCPTAARTRGSSRATCRTEGENSGGRMECDTWESGEEGRRRGRGWRCGREGRRADYGRAATGCAGSDCTLLYMLLYD